MNLVEAAGVALGHLTARDGGNAIGLYGTILALAFATFVHLTAREGGNAIGLSGTILAMHVIEPFAGSHS